MDADRWRQVEELYHAALDLPVAERASLLDRADVELRREVESLLEQNGSVLDRPAWDGSVSATVTIISAGTQLGPYRVERPIGEGGMGQVFRAVDTRLNRAVAIKTSNSQFDARFEREAKAIARLNHPNICTLHDVGPNYLVMELVDGETLGARLKKGPLPIDQTLKFGAQIADALAAAHAKGIVHRDLKPGNVMIAKTGVKVLDFGIAKSSGDVTLTGSHAVIGTPAYMSPEQREGKECDARSDIYSLGLVLREMSSGSRSGQTGGSPQFVHIVERCLAPEPEDRWQSASDIRKELEWAGVSQPILSTASGRSQRLPWVVAALACAGLLGAGVAIYRVEKPADTGRSEFTISFPNLDAFSNNVPRPSPDGRACAFVGNDSDGVTSVWIRPLESVNARRLPGTEGLSGTFIWSYDGAWIAFFAGGKLKKVRASGGTPETIAELRGFQDAAWGPQGDIIFRTTNRAPLLRIRDSGGSPQPLTTLNASLTENSHRHPEFLPDGRRFLFVTRCGERSNNALYMGSLDSPEVKRLMPAQAQVSYIAPRNGRPGGLLLYRDGALLMQPFDFDKGKAMGDATPVLNGVSYNAPSIFASYRASADGQVIIAGAAGTYDSRLVWFSRNGEERGALGTRGEYGQPRISPDGERVVFQLPDPQTGNRDIFYIEISRGITHRLTTHVANDWYPVWSPDGRQILFGSDRDGGTLLVPYLKTSMDPGSSESRLGAADTPPYDWSKDGKWISYGAADIEIAPASGTGKPFKFLATPAVEVDGRFAPDGKWIAYSSNESGRSEIYVRPFLGAPAASSGKIQISNSGGEYPVWGPLGREIFYMSADSAIYSVDTSNLGRADTVPPPSRLFQSCPGTIAQGPPRGGDPFNYAFDTQDGKRFLAVCRAEPIGRFTILMNWKFPG